MRQAIRAIGSLQLQAQGTLGGELCQRPRCWYFRDGQGLLADRGRAVAEGDNRYHAIFGNAGPGQVCLPLAAGAGADRPGRQACASIGPSRATRRCCRWHYFFRTPEDERQRENELLPEPDRGRRFCCRRPTAGQARRTKCSTAAGPIIRWSPPRRRWRSRGGVVTEARIVLGQVAPTPWISTEAAESIVGLPVNDETAAAAGEAAVSVATPLSDNEYKVQLARVAVKRASCWPPAWKREDFNSCPTNDRLDEASRTA